ncbi:MAG: mechanosensitive ion channel [Pseudomonadota bacterium]|nr:mechanosensitive ion channel [Pseudomonadota bacterium]
MNESGPEFGARLLELRQAAFDPANLNQWGLILAALLLGLLVRRMVRRASGADLADAFPDVAGSLSALLGVLVAWRQLYHHQHPALLGLAVPLLVALTVTRLATHLLRTLLASRLALAAGWERRITRLVWAAFALHLLGVLDLLLDMLQDLTLRVGTHEISVLQIMQSGLLLLVAVLVSLWAGRVIERRIMGMASVDTSLRVIFTKLVRGLLLALAVVIALPLLGIDITFLSVLGGALGVGLGFGLQKIASNYVSGFIILLDRSVRLNDLISVDGRKGVVSHMEARYTVLRGGDGSETIVPNETFVTAVVINHTLNDRAGALGFPLWLTHDADLHLAIDSLEALLRARPEVIATPAPAVQVSQATEVGIEIQVSWWVSDLAQADPGLRPALLLAALDCLREHGICLARRPGNSLPAS